MGGQQQGGRIVSFSRRPRRRVAAVLAREVVGEVAPLPPSIATLTVGVDALTIVLVNADWCASELALAVSSTGT